MHKLINARRVVLIANETITATTEHPFWLENARWVPASSLRLGDRVRTKDDGFKTIVKGATPKACFRQRFDKGFLFLTPWTYPGS